MEHAQEAVGWLAALGPEVVQDFLLFSHGHLQGQSTPAAFAKAARRLDVEAAQVETAVEALAYILSLLASGQSLAGDFPAREQIDAYY